MKLIMENWRKYLKEGISVPSGGEAPQPYKKRAFKNSDRMTVLGLTLEKWKDKQSFHNLLELSLIKFVKYTCTDKDILSMLEVVKNPKFGNLRFAYSDDFKMGTYAAADKKPKGDITINTVNIQEYFIKEYKDLFVKLSKLILEQEPRKGKLYNMEQSEDDILQDSAAEKFTGFIGNLCIFFSAPILVHELAHAFDPDDSFNLSPEDRDKNQDWLDQLSGDKYASEIFAVNKARRYIFTDLKNNINSMDYTWVNTQRDNHKEYLSNILKEVINIADQFQKQYGEDHMSMIKKIKPGLTSTTLGQAQAYSGQNPKRTRLYDKDEL